MWDWRYQGGTVYSVHTAVYKGSALYPIRKYDMSQTPSIFQCDRIIRSFLRKPTWDAPLVGWSPKGSPHRPELSTPAGSSLSTVHSAFPSRQRDAWLAEGRGDSGTFCRGDSSCSNNFDYEDIVGSRPNSHCHFFHRRPSLYKGKMLFHDLTLSVSFYRP